MGSLESAKFGSDPTQIEVYMQQIIHIIQPKDQICFFSSCCALIRQDKQNFIAEFTNDLLQVLLGRSPAAVYGHIEAKVDEIRFSILSSIQRTFIYLHLWRSAVVVLTFSVSWIPFVRTFSITSVGLIHTSWISGALLFILQLLYLYAQLLYSLYY